MSIRTYNASGLPIETVPFDDTAGGTENLTTKAPTSNALYDVTRTRGVVPNGGNSSMGSSSVAPFLKFLKQHVNAGSAFQSVVFTYDLVYTVASAYSGGVLAPNGDIHMIPRSAAVGQKINSAGVVSTYSLVYTVVTAYAGGVLAPNGDIHMIPYSAAVGQKINSAGVVSTYSLVYTVANAYAGGVLAPNGDIYFVPRSATMGQKISTYPAKPFSINMCLSGFFNKL